MASIVLVFLHCLTLKLMPLVKVFLDCLTLKIMTSSSLLELPDPKDDDTSSCLLGLPDSGDEITTLLQNVGNYLTVDTTLLPWTLKSSVHTRSTYQEIPPPFMEQKIKLSFYIIHTVHFLIFYILTKNMNYRICSRNLRTFFFYFGRWKIRVRKIRGFFYGGLDLGFILV